MHPVSYLFEDIYRNYWGIAPASKRPERHWLAKLRRRIANCSSSPSAGRTSSPRFYIWRGQASGTHAHQRRGGDRQPAGNE